MKIILVLGSGFLSQNVGSIRPYRIYRQGKVAPLSGGEAPEMEGGKTQLSFTFPHLPVFLSIGQSQPFLAVFVHQPGGDAVKLTSGISR